VIAARHRRALPAALRLFLRGSGATRSSGSDLLSYLLFEAEYCNELIELGRRDALARADDLCNFLGLERVQAGALRRWASPAVGSADPYVAQGSQADLGLALHFHALFALALQRIDLALAYQRVDLLQGLESGNLLIQLTGETLAGLLYQLGMLQI